MSDESTTLKGQYAAQVAADLERNQKEQERITSEVEALQAELTALQSDLSLLVTVQKALGDDTALPEVVPAPGDAAETAPAAPARKTPAGVTRASVPRARRAVSNSGGKAKKSAASTRARSNAHAESGSGPTLRDLVADHLAQQNEPRSVAELTTELQAMHTNRTMNIPVVRNTLENLVSRGEAQRSKQGRSVYYSATPGQPAGEAAAEPVAAEA